MCVYYRLRETHKTYQPIEKYKSYLKTLKILQDKTMK